MKSRNLSKKDQNGVALLISLMVILVLAVLVHRFTYATRINLISAANLRDLFQAECMAISGLEAALAVLATDDTPEVDHLGEPWALFRGSPDLSGEVVQAEEGFLVQIRDESSKIEINRIVRQDGSTTDPLTRQQLDRLLEIFGVPSDMRDSLLDCLEDWIDRDDLQKLNGAEDPYYTSLDPPYRAANRPLRALGELNLVKGWKEVLDLRLQDGSSILDFLTIAPTGGRINVNTASPIVLRTLSPEIDEAIAEQVVTLREEAPLSGPQLLPPPFKRKEVSSRLRYSGNYFSLKSIGVFRHATSRAEMMVRREQGDWAIVARRIE